MCIPCAAAPLRPLPTACVGRRWDSTNGEINRKQFCKNVRTLVADAADEELLGLFSSLDEDDGGTLDLEELKAALTQARACA